MNKVFIIKGDDAYEAASKLLDRMDFSIRGKKVFIKANVHPERVPSTDVNVIRAITERLKGCQITVGGNLGIRGKPFEVNGYDRLKGVRLLNIEKDERVSMDVAKPLRFKKILVSKTMLDSDYVVNAAKLKIHHHVGATLCLKNLFGCIPGREKQLMHPQVIYAIHDYIQVMRSDLNVIDGIVGNQRDECLTYPIKSGIMIGGYEPISVDVVGVKCMGVNPEEVEYLRLLKYKDRKIEVVGEKIEDVRKSFDRRQPLSRPIRNFLEMGLRTALKLNLIST